MTLLDDLQATIAGAAERVGPSIVGLGRGWAAGSGVVVGEGRVVTVAHAVRRGTPAITFADGRRVEAETFTADLDAGLALLEVDTGDAPAAQLAHGERPGLRAPPAAAARPSSRWPIRAGVACARPSASSPPPSAASAARAGGASPAPSSIPPPSPAARPAAR